ncbi:cytochrome P450 [Thozetella sp. PMI_491]|nr:cytochrome P450 [Thozetella sp. PMI_491]
MFYSSPIFLAFIGLILAYSSIQYARSAYQSAQFAKKHGCRPAQSFAKGGDPVIGLSFLLETIKRAKNNEYMRVTLERFRTFGNTYVNKRLLYQTVHTIDSENAKEVFSTSFDAFQMPGIRVKALTTLFGDGIFVTDGPKWSHQRALLRPLFTRQNMGPMLGRFEKYFQLFLQHIPKDGSSVDLRELFYDLTLDVATDFLMGRSTNTLDPTTSSKNERQFAEDYLHCCTDAVRKIQLGPLYPFSSNAEIIPSRDRAWRFVDQYVDEALRRREKKSSRHPEGGDEYNFLTELAQFTDDRQVLRDQLLNILLASRDTTAALLGNLFFMLARHPEVYAKLRSETLDVVGPDQQPTEAHFKAMPWLNWCINESLRIHPVIPANTRQAARDIALPVGGGADGKSPLFVKKGTNVLFNLYSMHRREDIFGPNVDDFKPERWDGLRPGWAYMPFNAGPRTCLGQQFAMIEASYMIVRMAQTFEEIKSRDDRPYTEYYTIALFSKNGVHVSLKRREEKEQGVAVLEN